MTNQIHELLIICIGRTVAPLYVRVQCVLNGGDDSSSIIRVVEELRPILLGFFFSSNVSCSFSCVYPRNSKIVHWCHMGYTYDWFTTLLALSTVDDMSCHPPHK